MPKQYLDENGNPIPQKKVYLDANGNPVSQPSFGDTVNQLKASGALQQSPSAPFRFVQSFSQNVGAPERMSDVPEGLQMAVSHPVQSAKLLGQSMADAQQSVIDKAYEEQHSPNWGTKAKGVMRGVYAALPLVGPALSHAGDQFGEGDIAGGAGSVAGMATGALAGEYGPAARAKVTMPARVREFMQGKASDLYQSALKPSTAKKAPNPASLVKAGLENNIPVSAAGVEKLSTLIEDVNNKIANEIKSRPNATISRNQVAARLQEPYDRFSNQVNPTADQTAIADAGVEFLRTQPKNISAVDAQALKIGTYQQLKGKYGQLSGASIEAQKALARGIKEELNTVFPELKQLNAKDAQLLQLEPALVKAVNRVANHDVMGIGTPIAVGAAKAATGSTIISAVVGTLKGIMTPSMKSKLAMAIYKAGNGRISLPAAQARVEGYAASLAGASSAKTATPDDQGTQ